MLIGEPWPTISRKQQASGTIKSILHRSVEVLDLMKGRKENSHRCLLSHQSSRLSKLIEQQSIPRPTFVPLPMSSYRTRFALEPEYTNSLFYVNKVFVVFKWISVQRPEVGCKSRCRFSNLPIPTKTYYQNHEKNQSHRHVTISNIWFRRHRPSAKAE
jgi:hypothetical protein